MDAVCSLPTGDHACDRDDVHLFVVAVQVAVHFSALVVDTDAILDTTYRPGEPVVTTLGSGCVLDAVTPCAWCRRLYE